MFERSGAAVSAQFLVRSIVLWAGLVLAPTLLHAAAPPQLTLQVRDITAGQTVAPGATVPQGDELQVTVATDGVDCAGQFVVSAGGASGQPAPAALESVSFSIGPDYGGDLATGGSFVASSLGGANAYTITATATSSGASGSASFAFLAGAAAPGAQVLTWADEFDSTALNSLSWAYDIGNNGGWGNQELEYYTDAPSNVSVDGTALNIVDLNQPNYLGSGFDWTSGRIYSLPGWTYGQMQIRAELPTGDGVWPAIWMLPFLDGYGAAGLYGNGNWPDNGEIDIMEEFGFNPNEVLFTLHNFDVGADGTGSGDVSVPTATTAYHIYGLDWAPDHISGSVDGNVVYTAQRGGNDWHWWPFDQPFHFLINDAIGGNPGGNDGVDPGISGQDLAVDYVRVYKKTSGPYGGSAPTLPGTIEAANYDIGGEGYAYHSSTATNTGGLYRNDGIGIGASGETNNPYYVGWMSPDEWLNYTVAVPVAGLYTVTPRVASMDSGEALNVQADDVTLGTVSVANTGGWTTWVSQSLPAPVALTAGTHVLRLLSNTANWNIDSITCTAVDASPPTGLAAMSVGRQIRLTWIPSSGAAGYNVYMGRASGREETRPIAKVTGTGFTVLTPKPGGTYYFEVTATDAAGESARSAEVSSRSEFFFRPLAH